MLCKLGIIVFYIKPLAFMATHTQRLRMVRPIQYGQQTQHGFILVATLFAVALMALGAAYFASRVDSLRNSAIQTSRWADAEREAFSLRETIMHAAATHLRLEGGLSVIDVLPQDSTTSASPVASVAIPSNANATRGASLALDGRRYKISDTVTLQVQDERGLIAINIAETRLLTRLFTDIGIPAEQHARLIDGLADYIDDDDFKRLNGAEKNEYFALGRAPPANDFLRSRDEMSNIAGWTSIFDALDQAEPLNPGIRERFLALFSIARHFGLNINSAPANVLAAYPGIDRARVMALIDARRIKPFVSVSELLPFANGRLDDELTGFTDAGTWRITVAKAELPFLLECTLIILPGDRNKPVQTQACRRRSPDVMSQGGDATTNEFAMAWRAFNNDRGRSNNSVQSQSGRSGSSVFSNPISPSENNFANRRSTLFNQAEQADRGNEATNSARETPAPRWLVEATGRAGILGEIRN